MQRDELVKIIKGFKGVCPFGAPDLGEPAAAALYFQHFKEWPTERLISILSRLTTSGRFPSIDEIKRAGGEDSQLEADPKLQSIADAEKIHFCVGRFGGDRGDEAREYMGEFLWKLTEKLLSPGSGFKGICDTLLEKDVAFKVAQWAKVIELYRRQGYSDKKQPEIGPQSGEKPLALQQALDIIDKGQEE